MSEEIIKVIDALAKRFGVAIDWSNQNIMPYLQELFAKFVNYEMYTSIALIVIFTLLCILLVTAIRYVNTHKDFGVDDDLEDAGRGFCYVFIIIFLALFIFGIVTQIFDIITCKVFPEKVVFDTIQKLYTK